MGAQHALRRASWPGPELKVRIGIHLGESEERNADYFGPVLNTAARIEAGGHGGQTLISEAVRQAVDIDSIVLGSHRLRDVPARIRLRQVGDGAFGPLRVPALESLLPARRGRLLGRDALVASIQASQLAASTGAVAARLSGDTRALDQLRE